jgi:methionine synthase I (cobalamin-dependent)
MTTILDGGMGRELQRLGAPFRQPEWSALALMEGPEFVTQAHERFALAGAKVISTNNYAVVPFHIGEERFLKRGTELARLAGKLARDVANRHDLIVAGSLPPVLGSYRPDLFEVEAARAILAVLIEGLSPFADIWLAETLTNLDDDQKKIIESYLQGHHIILIGGAGCGKSYVMKRLIRLLFAMYGDEWCKNHVAGVAMTNAIANNMGCLSFEGIIFIFF